MCLNIFSNSEESFTFLPLIVPTAGAPTIFIPEQLALFIKFYADDMSLCIYLHLIHIHFASLF